MMTIIISRRADTNDLGLEPILRSYNRLRMIVTSRAATRHATRHEADLRGSPPCHFPGSADPLPRGDLRADAVLHDQIADVPQHVKETGDGRARIAGEQMNAALGFEAAFHEQFITGKDFVAGIGQKARISSHGQSILVRPRGECQ